ncbi:DUF2231 domain-containing protein [Porphyrobacter sp. GA68]|uniref:DUF2231 domain-containing protein n=1 Tax=Porphyrobacter sp. GA68 TaxID=2883480 RepID=UPI001D18F00A|nr:DUF2231 domain-containing protein [Porphyrobacter sp. GA68]
MSALSPRLGKFWRLILAVVAAFALANLFVTPAVAHEEHRKQQAAAEARERQLAGGAAESPMGHEAMEGMVMEMDRSNLPFFERLFGWIGRLHPALVHFPIAFFPAALFTVIVGRKRPAFAAPVQFLVVAGGIFAPVAAAAGWLAAVGSDPDPILNYHRWIGVAVGIVGAGLGVWAWKRPWEDRGAGMILALTIMTVAIVIQGFLGAAVTHGFEHLMF